MVGPSDKPLGGLEIVEEFYGEEASLSLYKKIRETPSYQLIELADRIADNSTDAINLMLNRHQGSEPSSHGFDGDARAEASHPTYGAVRPS